MSKGEKKEERKTSSDICVGNFESLDDPLEGLIHQRAQLVSKNMSTEMESFRQRLN